MDKVVCFAVCDDDEIVCEAICSKIKRLLSGSGIDANVDKYVSPMALYENIEKSTNRYDALFLDIDMPKLNGVDLAKALNKLPEKPDIIFVSNREDMVFETFSAHPFGFVRKNNFTHDLADTLCAYIAARVTKNACLGIKTNNNSVVRKIKVAQVVYIESFKNKQVIHMADGEEIECRMSMEEFEDKLREYDIVRVYKGYLVNFRYVQRIERSGILLSYKNVIINVSRDKVQELKALYLQYLRRTGIVTFDEED